LRHFRRAEEAGAEQHRACIRHADGKDGDAAMAAALQHAADMRFALNQVLGFEIIEHRRQRQDVAARLKSAADHVDGFRFVQPLPRLGLAAAQLHDFDAAPQLRLQRLRHRVNAVAPFDTDGVTVAYQRFQQPRASRADVLPQGVDVAVRRTCGHAHFGEAVAGAQGFGERALVVTRVVDGNADKARIGGVLQQFGDGRARDAERLRHFVLRLTALVVKAGGFDSLDVFAGQAAAGVGVFHGRGEVRNFAISSLGYALWANPTDGIALEFIRGGRYGR